jgi:hypothetical protein
MSQIRSIRASCNNAGYALYSASSFDKINAPIQDSLRRQAASIALPPTMPWLDNTPPGAPRALDADRRGQGTILKWRTPDGTVSNETLWYAIYRFPKGVTPDPQMLPAPVAVTQERSWVDVERCPDCRYAVTALDRTWNESSPATDAVGWLK